MKIIFASLITVLVSTAAQAAFWKTSACPQSFLAQLSPEGRDFYATLDVEANSPQFESFVKNTLSFSESNIFEELLRCDEKSLNAMAESQLRPHVLMLYPENYEKNGTLSVENDDRVDLSIYQGNFLLSSYFQSMSHEGLATLKKQAWIEWNRAGKKFIYHDKGAESYILKKQMKDKLYRGASIVEFEYILAIKWLIQPQVDLSRVSKIKTSIGNAMKAWSLSGEVLNIYSSVESVARSSQQERIKVAKSLVSVVSRYPAIMLGVVGETAVSWAFEHEGPNAQKVVAVFDVNAANMSKDAFAGFYAGTEGDYFEIGFVTPESRLFLVSHLEEEPITRQKAEIEFPYLKNY